MPPVAKKQKTGSKKAPKEKCTAIVEIDPYAQTWIYLIIDRATSKVIYVGQTLDSSRRWKEHERKVGAETDSRLKDYLEKKQRGINLLDFRHVAELPNGVAHKDADAFEAYYISEYKTQFDMIANPDGCNLTAGNRAYKVDPAEIRAKLEKGYEWPEPAQARVAALQAVSDKLKDARFLEAVLDDIDTRANTDPEKPIEGLAEALGEARLVLGRMEGDGLYEYVRDILLPPYEAMPAYEEVARSTVVGELNSVSDRAKEADEELGKAIKWEGKALLLDHWREVPMTANEAALKMRIVLAVVGRFAEKKLDPSSTNIQNWVTLRKWSTEHGGKAPSGSAKKRPLRPSETYADLVEEERLGHIISTWKLPFEERRRTCTGRPEEASAYILLRDFPTLLKVIAPKAERDAKFNERDAMCVAHLKRRMASTKEREAYPHESEAEGLVPFSVKGTDMAQEAFQPVQCRINNFVNGQNPEFKEKLRAAADDTSKLTHARVDRLIKLHETNRPALLSQAATSHAERQKRRAENAAASSR